MVPSVIIIGSGIGGLTAAITFARAGFAVTVLESRACSGGLVGGFVTNGVSFDGGPYILLDSSGLRWVFAQLGLDFDELDLRSIDEVYSVADSSGETVRIFSSVERTVEDIESQWPRAGAQYRSFVENMLRIYKEYSPVLGSGRPNAARVMSLGAAAHSAFMRQSLDALLKETKLPPSIGNAVGVWGRMSGRTRQEVPASAALITALIHSSGAYLPADGMCQISKVLTNAAQRLGVNFRFNTKVNRIVVKDAAVQGVVTTDGEMISERLILSDCGAQNTYLMLADSGLSRALRTQINEMPLYSPGVCAYMSVKGIAESPYLRFFLPDGVNSCRMLIRPDAVTGITDGAAWQPARLMAPLPHHEAEQMGHSGQAEYLASILHESWWRSMVSEHRLLATRTPSGWGREFSLFRDSTNATMALGGAPKDLTGHRSPYLKGLYLAGSSSHPGSGVTYCGISGILSARRMIRDLKH